LFSYLIPQAVALFYTTTFFFFNNFFSFSEGGENHIGMNWMLCYANTYFVLNMYRFKWLFI